MKRISLIGSLILFVLFANIHVVFSKSRTANLSFKTSNGEKFKVWVNDVLQHSESAGFIKIVGVPTPHCMLTFQFDDATIAPIKKRLHINVATTYKYIIQHFKKNNKLSYQLQYKTERKAILFKSFVKKDQRIVKNRYNGLITVPYRRTNMNKLALKNIKINEEKYLNKHFTHPKYKKYKKKRKGRKWKKYKKECALVLQKKKKQIKDSLKRLNAHPPRAKMQACRKVLSKKDYKELLLKMKGESFEKEKMLVAKRMISEHCLSVKEVKELLAFFDFEKTKIDFAKFAYHSLTDAENASDLFKAFEFESSQDDWEDYMASLEEE